MELLHVQHAGDIFAIADDLRVQNGIPQAKGINAIFELVFDRGDDCVTIVAWLNQHSSAQADMDVIGQPKIREDRDWTDLVDGVADRILNPVFSIPQESRSNGHEYVEEKRRTDTTLFSESTSIECKELKPALRNIDPSERIE